MKCCCHGIGETCPISMSSNHVHRCRACAMDLGHCQGANLDQTWCCGGSDE